MINNPDIFQTIQAFPDISQNPDIYPDLQPCTQALFLMKSFLTIKILPTARFVFPIMDQH